MSQVSSLEEEVVQLKQELKTSELSQEELSAEVREYRKVKMESGVSGSEGCTTCSWLVMVCELEHFSLPLSISQGEFSKLSYIISIVWFH